MRVIVDENIPYATEALAPHAEVIRLPGRGISAADLRRADALWVRSITQVDQALLGEADRLQFVGTATAGFDHVDRALLASRGITFTNAPGCNAPSVVDYVISAMLLLAERQGFKLTDKRVGIVGVGQIGGRLHRRLSALGVECLLCDPPLQRSGDLRPFVDLETALQADIVTLHIPLTHQGQDATFHLLDQARLAALKPGAILINAARGAVVDNQALLALKRAKQDLSLVLDAWEGEPVLLDGLIDCCELGTAHIAGYSLEGKAMGTWMLYQSLAKRFGFETASTMADWLPAPTLSAIELSGPLDQAVLKTLVHAVYDVRRDDALLRRHWREEGGFDRLRKHYPVRREFGSLRIRAAGELGSALDLLGQIGFSTRGND